MKHKKRRFPIILNPSSAPVLAANDNDHFITLSLSTENSDSVPNSEMDQNEEGEMKNVASTDFGLKPLATTLETVGKLKVWLFVPLFIYYTRVRCVCMIV